jgi:hypothetical protein
VSQLLEQVSPLSKYTHKTITDPTALLREIEVVRLPTGQPAVRLEGRARRRAEQLGMGRIALAISHERDYAVAIAFGVRSEGGAYVFPVDIEARLDDRERRILARMDRLRALATSGVGKAENEVVDGDG